MSQILRSKPYLPVEVRPAGGGGGGVGDCDECWLGGWTGGTPHSGKPFGRSIRLGSHSSSPAALSF